MGMTKVCTGLFLASTMYLLFVHQFHNALAAPGNINNLETHRPRLRALARFAPKAQYLRNKPDQTDFIVDDDDLFELSKRQTSDDYGHLRFGKRGEESFDDYGHMRYGRSGTTDK